MTDRRDHPTRPDLRLIHAKDLVDAPPVMPPEILVYETQLDDDLLRGEADGAPLTALPHQVAQCDVTLDGLAYHCRIAHARAHPDGFEALFTTTAHDRYRHQWMPLFDLQMMMQRFVLWALDTHRYASREPVIRTRPDALNASLDA